MTLPPDLRVRAARSRDGDAIGALTRACDETYRAWAPSAWAPPAVVVDWGMRLEQSGRWSLVAVDGDSRIVALVSFRPARSVDPPGGAGEGEPLPAVAHLSALLVHPSRWREGIGAALLARAETAMAGSGYRDARLWTPDGAPAERFYRARGWSSDGRRGFNDWLGMAMVGYAKTLARPALPDEVAARR